MRIKHTKTFGIIRGVVQIEYVRTPEYMRDGRLVSAPSKRELRYLDVAMQNFPHQLPGLYLLIVDFIGPVPVAAALHNVE